VTKPSSTAKIPEPLQSAQGCVPWPRQTRQRLSGGHSTVAPGAGSARPVPDRATWPNSSSAPAPRSSERRFTHVWHRGGGGTCILGRPTVHQQTCRIILRRIRLSRRSWPAINRSRLSLAPSCRWTLFAGSLYGPCCRIANAMIIRKDSWTVYVQLPQHRTRDHHAKLKSPSTTLDSFASEDLILADMAAVSGHRMVLCYISSAPLVTGAVNDSRCLPMTRT
jgi:hypothetical protein